MKPDEDSEELLDPTVLSHVGFEPITLGAVECDKV